MDSLTHKQTAKIGRTIGWSKLRLSDIRGFTIAEILVVTAIIGILAVIAVPQFMTYQYSIRLNSATRHVFGELMSARMKAVNENQTYTVSFPTDHSMQISGATTKTIDIDSLYSGVKFSTTPATMQFNSRGTADVAQTLTIHCAVAGNKTVSVKITGAVTIS